jgi:hypothetical protein
MEWIDGELCLVKDEEIVHTFERGKLPRATYKHMAAWTQKNFDSEIGPHELWARAARAWEVLDEQHKIIIWSLAEQEAQNARDISDGLLATLAGYQGLAAVKSSYADAIKSVRDNF